MKVKELIKILEEKNPESYVVVINTEGGDSYDTITDVMDYDGNVVLY